MRYAAVYFDNSSYCPQIGTIHVFDTLEELSKFYDEEIESSKQFYPDIVNENLRGYEEGGISLYSAKIDEYVKCYSTFKTEN